jgi:hypothetical protein
MIICIASDIASDGRRVVSEGRKFHTKGIFEIFYFGFIDGKAAHWQGNNRRRNPAERREMEAVSRTHLSAAWKAAGRGPKKGRDTSDDLQTVNKIIKNQLDVLLRIGNVGRFATMDVLERMNMMGSSLSSNLIRMTKEETQKYRKFLESELKKLDDGESGHGKDIKID